MDIHFVKENIYSLKQLIAIFAQGSRGNSRDNGEEEEEEVREIMEQGTVKFRLSDISNQFRKGSNCINYLSMLCSRVRIECHFFDIER